MNETDKKSLGKIVKEFLIEILIVIVFAAIILIVILNKSFSNKIITEFEFLRPDYSIIWFGVMMGLTILLFLLLFLWSRKKKLSSTKKRSAFDKTLECLNEVRKMSQTQAVFEPEIQIVSKKNDLANDKDKNNSNVVELYFTYEEKLNI